MEIRKTKPEDIEPLLALIEEARASIARLGIDQWQNGSPNRPMFEEDIALQRSYIATDGEHIFGTMALLLNGEPSYDRIDDGGWLTAGNYLTMHRVAIALCRRGSGLSGELVAFAEQTARENGLGSVRIDTHRGNLPMRHMLAAHGFTHCGTVYLETGEERVAYEKVLPKSGE